MTKFSPSLELKATLRGHSGVVWSVAWSPRGVLASSGADRSVRVWTRETSNDGAWTCIAQLSGETFLRTVRCVTWGVDGRSLAAACFDATATVLELMGGKEPRLEAAVSLEGHESEVKSLAYSSSGGLLASCSRDRSVWIWEVGVDFDYECISVLNGHSADVKCVRWHPEAEILVSCGYDSTIRVWVEDEDDWFCLEELTAHDSTVWGVAFDKSGKHMVSVGDRGVLVVWRRTDPPIQAIGEHAKYIVVAHLDRLHDGSIYAVDWAPTSNLIATCGSDDAIRILKRTADKGGEDEKIEPLAADTELETATVDSKESDQIGESRKKTTPASSTAIAIAAGADKETPTPASGQADNVRNTNGNDCVTRAASEEETRPNGAHASELRTKTDQVWEVEVVAHRAHLGDVNCVAWNPVDETVLASCGDDCLVRIWTLALEQTATVPTSVGV
jgi:cytosolic iron-sulfur protein assembly protein CIAO1